MTSFGQHDVVPGVGRYHDRYPDVQIGLAVSQRLPALLDAGLDVALTRATGPPGLGLVSHRMGRVCICLCP
ncbi:LysR substrate-binding domain-containing protein, partial [Paraburkholderia ginsengiterrae]|uniref:LysR substrate-binding domain-containing protein n=1 Tax=Paraburkholderia ginsengiterrae TaxID=1462993 RepID=UPI000B1961B5